MRILADLPEEDVKWLDRLAQDTGRSRAALLREAVAAYRVRSSGEGIEAFFGMWRARGDIGDGVDYQRSLRDEWDRDWDIPGE